MTDRATDVWMRFGWAETDDVDETCVNLRAAMLDEADPLHDCHAHPVPADLVPGICKDWKAMGVELPPADILGLLRNHGGHLIIGFAALPEVLARMFDGKDN